MTGHVAAVGNYILLYNDDIAVRIMSDTEQEVWSPTLHCTPIVPSAVVFIFDLFIFTFLSFFHNKCHISDYRIGLAFQLPLITLTYSATYFQMFHVFNFIF